MPISTRRRADELARALDAAPPRPRPAAGARVAPQPGPPALERTGGLDRELALAARLAALGDGPAAAPREEFRAALRTRLVAVATVQGVGPATALPAPRRSPALAGLRAQRLGVAAGAMASVVAVAGVAVAGSRSLPGDPFYGVKRTTEALQLQVAGDDLDTGTRHLDLAETRLREVRALALGRDAVAVPLGGVAGTPVAAGGTALGGPLSERIAAALADMDDSTRDGVRLLTDAHRASRDEEPLRRLAAFATRQGDRLTALLPALPAPVQARATASLGLVATVEDRAGELLELTGCLAACDPAQVAPDLPSSPGAGPAGEAEPCGCPTPVPAPAASATPGGTTEPPAPDGSPAAPGGTPPTAQPGPGAGPGSPDPAPRPTGTRPLPVPTRLPPSSAVPLPTSTRLPVPAPVPTRQTLPAVPLPTASTPVPQLPELPPLPSPPLPSPPLPSAPVPSAPVPGADLPSALGDLLLGALTGDPPPPP